MRTKLEKATIGVILRFLILVLLILSLVLIGSFHGERDAYIGPVIVTLLALAVVCSHLIYNKIMHPAPDDLMYARNQDYIIAIIWCGIFFCYLEALACIQYAILPNAFPSVVVSPVVFQGLVLVPMAISVTWYVLWEILINLVSLKNITLEYYRQNPKSFWGFGVFIIINGAIFYSVMSIVAAFREGQIDKATANQIFSVILWVMILMSIGTLVYTWIINNRDSC
ncbi:MULTISPECIES: hypothetical protein [unclassified Methanoregula]|uniref:hypothetical protein n=1 Tax=unclassified Methanoregula TaxID=2649730 RepID=UPI0009CCA502|nr:MULTISPECIES: hypothetical protein [unclassified Methanoregula]OPX63358.1 MAG: hypothetical protein A4E33_01727 [Methanoregula sp. PtaB.Bin085]OPY35038.1 MAG: hypothetical protein A4E34_01060 [Methanoregula sp. PtaU1.Bin006]